MSEIKHPGWYVQQELLNRGRTQKDFAYLLGKKGSEVNELIKGKRNITVHRDLLLSKVFNDPEKKWIHLQVEYEYQKIKTNTEDQKIQELIQRKNNYQNKQISGENQLHTGAKNSETKKEQVDVDIVKQEEKTEQNTSPQQESGQQAKEGQEEDQDKKNKPLHDEDLHHKHQIFKNF